MTPTFNDYLNEEALKKLRKLKKELEAEEHKSLNKELGELEGKFNSDEKSQPETDFYHPGIDLTPAGSGFLPVPPPAGRQLLCGRCSQRGI